METIKRLHLSAVFAAVAAVLLSLASCKGPEEPEIISAHLVSFLPGEEGFELVLSGDIKNPNGKIVLSEISGTVFVSESRLASFTADDVTLEARTTDSYTVRIHIVPSPGVTLLTMLKLGKLSPDDFSLNVESKVKYGKLKAVKVSRENVKLKEMASLMSLI